MVNQIAFKDHTNALWTADMLVQENYVVMLSREGDLYILNYIYSPEADRNEVIFDSIENYEEEIENIIADIKSDMKKGNIIFD